MSLLKNNGELAGRTVLVMDASKGIGKAIAVKAAQDGANVVIASPNATREETIYTAAKEVEAAGGRCLPCSVDICDEDQVQAAVDKAIEVFGGIDVLINSASAPTDTPTNSDDVMTGDIMRGTYLTSKLCLPHLLKSRNPHILNISPPLNTVPMWFAPHFTCNMAKYGVSMSVLGMAEEFREEGVAVNALWPSTGGATGAFTGGEFERHQSCCVPEIMADAAYAVLSKPSRECTGQFLLDDQVLVSEGITDLAAYLCKPGEKSLLKALTDMTTPAGVFAAFNSLLTEEVVKLINGSFLFELSGKNADCWLLDLKTAPGSVGPASKETNADVRVRMSSENMVDLFTGKLGVTAAVETGKMMVLGNTELLLKLEKLIGLVRSNL